MEYRAIYTDGTRVLVHHGIKGQKWGVRRYQNPDGSLTPEGRTRYLKAVEQVRSLRGSFDNQEGFDKYLKTLKPIDRVQQRSFRKTNQKDYKKALAFLREFWEPEILKAEEQYYGKNKNGNVSSGYSALVKKMKESGMNEAEIAYIIYGK